MIPLNDSMSIHFQPQVHVRTGDIYAFEAINSNLAESVYFQHCLSTLIEWQNMGIHQPMSITLSSDALLAPETLALFSQFTRTHNLSAPIIFQVSLAPCYPAAPLAAVLEQFQTLGASICLDEFGHGHTCYDSLRQLPSDSIILSQTFIEHLLCNTQDFTLVSHLIRLMREFKKRLIVKNVSNLTLGKLLLQMGVEYIQGDSIAPAMTAKQAFSWQQTWQLPDIWHAPDANPWPDEHQHLLKATVAHRQWLTQLEIAVQTQTTTLDSNTDTQQASYLRCTLGRWMSNQGFRSYGHLDAFSEVDILHQAFHDAADRLLWSAKHQASPSDLESLWTRTRTISQALTEALLNLKNALYQD